MKVCRYILFVFLFTNICGFSQYNGLSYHHDPFHIIGRPTQTGCDTVISSYSSYNEDKKVNQNLIDYSIKLYYSDSSVVNKYVVESGETIDNKRYGKWLRINGNYENGNRLKGQQSNDYYFNDYLIPDAERFSDSISIDYEKRIARCYFTFEYIGILITLTSLMKVVYYIDKNTNYINCSTMDNIELFNTPVSKAEYEFEKLYMGYYNRKINGALTGQ